MKPGTYNFDIYQGTDLELPITITGMDLTSFTARAGMRSIWDTTAAQEFAVSLSGSGTSWTVTLSLSNAETSALKRQPGTPCPGKCTYFWDLEVVSADSKVSRIAQGQISVWPEACI